MDEELRIKDSWAVVEGEISELEGRASSLRGEVEKLNPRSSGHPHDILVRQHSRVSGTAAEERRALEELRERLVKAVDATAEPVAEVHDQTRAAVEAWSRERDWDPEFRARMQGQRVLG